MGTMQGLEFNFLSLNRQCTSNDRVFIFVSVNLLVSSEQGRGEPPSKDSYGLTKNTCHHVRNTRYSQITHNAKPDWQLLLEQTGWELGHGTLSTGWGGGDRWGGEKSIGRFCGWPRPLLIIISIHKHKRVKYSPPHPPPLPFKKYLT